jgi:hypothetical protein
MVEEGLEVILQPVIIIVLDILAKGFKKLLI